MKIVVTGALGHIGSRVIREIPAFFPGSEVVMIDNLITQRYCSLYDLPREGKYRFVEANILDVNLKELIKGADVVLHLAAITDAAGSFQNKEYVEHNNYTATVKVAMACADMGCSLIYISSTSVYGTQNAVVDENCSSRELRPQSPYAETKLREEKFLQDFGDKKKLRFLIFRFGTIYGISPGMRFHTAVNKFCWQAVMGRPLSVWRTALFQKRPYLALSDAARAIEFVIKNNLFDQKIYNVLTENLTVDEVIREIKKYIKHLDVQYVDVEIMNQLSYEVSTSRFMEKGFTFKGSIEKSISETIEKIKRAGGTHVG